MLYIHTVQESPGSDVFARQLAYLTADAERIILREASRLGITVMTARVNQSFIIYIKNSPAQTEDSLRSLLDRLEQNILLEIGKGYACLWGISELTVRTANFSNSYQQARQALVYGMHEEPDMSRVFYRNTRRALITTVLAASDKIQNAAEDVFRELQAYDKKTKVGLMRTLTVYLNSNYNATQTARELHLNRHSLLYRLHKIEQLTGLSLNDHEDLFVLESFALANAQKQ
jgi:purine catabolism regulator